MKSKITAIPDELITAFTSYIEINFNYNLKAGGIKALESVFAHYLGPCFADFHSEALNPSFYVRKFRIGKTESYVMFEENDVATAVFSDLGCKLVKDWFAFRDLFCTHLNATISIW